jgi:glycosyltransferase involved in cell wall biosynthesis
MKIAINVNLLNHHHKHGLFVYADNLLRNLAKIDFENEYFLLFTSLRKKSYQMPGPKQKNFIKKVLPVPDRNFPIKEVLLNRMLIPSYLKKLKCKIYHSLAGFSLPLGNGVRKIFTIHDLRSLRISDNSIPQDIKALHKTLREADSIITVSNTTKKDILEFFDVSSDKIKVIYLGVDERFKPIKNGEDLEFIKKKYGLNKKYFFSLGQVPRKNIKRLIKTFNIFKYKEDFLLVIGGVGNDGVWVKEYRELVDRMNLEDKVKFIGYIPDEDLPLLYNASKCFVFPSLYEGFGIPILEAMRCKIPVITSNVSALPEIGGEAALYVNPYDERDIAKTMEKIVEDEELRFSLIQKGLKRAKEFSWEKMARETLKIYYL